MFPKMQTLVEADETVSNIFYANLLHLNVFEHSLTTSDSDYFVILFKKLKKTLQQPFYFALRTPNHTTAA